MAHTLLLEGKPPRPLPPVHSVSVPSPKNRAGEASAPAVAAWSEDDKVLFSGGTWRRFDLKRDPHELDPQPVRDDDPRRSALLALHAELDAPPRKSPRASDQLIEQLKSLGYTE